MPELAKEVDDYGPEHNYPHCPAFTEIGKFRGPFDLGLIPIGAYDPRYIMVSLFRVTMCLMVKCRELRDTFHCTSLRGILIGYVSSLLIPSYVAILTAFQSPMHASPFDSVNIFKDTKCQRAMSIHWGTWVLTEEDVLEPPRLLKKALTKAGIPETGTFDVCEIGESREFM